MKKAKSPFNGNFKKNIIMETIGIPQIFGDMAFLATDIIANGNEFIKSQRAKKITFQSIVNELRDRLEVAVDNAIDMGKLSATASVKLPCGVEIEASVDYHEDLEIEIDHDNDLRDHSNVIDYIAEVLSDLPNVSEWLYLIEKQEDEDMYNEAMRNLYYCNTRLC